MGNKLTTCCFKKSRIHPTECYTPAKKITTVQRNETVSIKHIEIGYILPKIGINSNDGNFQTSDGNIESVVQSHSAVSSDATAKGNLNNIVDGELNKETLSGDGKLNKEVLSGDGKLNKEALSGDGELNKEALSGDGKLNKEALSGDDKLNKDALSGDDKLNKAALSGDDKLNKDALSGDDKVNKEALSGDDKLNKEVLSGDDKLNKEVLSGDGKLNKEVLSGDGELNKDVLSGDGELNKEVLSGEGKLNKEVLSGDGKLNKDILSGDGELNKEVLSGDGKLNKEVLSGDGKLNKEVLSGDGKLNKDVLSGDDKLNKEALSGDRDSQTSIWPNSSQHSFGRTSSDLESLHQIHSDASSDLLTIVGGERNKEVASSCKAIGTNAGDLRTTNEISRNGLEHSADGNFQTTSDIESFDHVKHDVCSESLANVWVKQNKANASGCKDIDTDDDSLSSSDYPNSSPSFGRASDSDLEPEVQSPASGKTLANVAGKLNKVLTSGCKKNENVSINRWVSVGIPCSNTRTDTIPEVVVSSKDETEVENSSPSFGRTSDSDLASEVQSPACRKSLANVGVKKMNKIITSGFKKNENVSINGWVSVGIPCSNTRKDTIPEVVVSSKNETEVERLVREEQEMCDLKLMEKLPVASAVKEKEAKNSDISKEEENRLFIEEYLNYFDR